MEAGLKSLLIVEVVKDERHVFMSPPATKTAQFLLVFKYQPLNSQCLYKRPNLYKLLSNLYIGVLP